MKTYCDSNAGSQIEPVLWNARESVWMISPWIGKDYATRLELLSQKGIEVRIITNLNDYNYDSLKIFKYSENANLKLMVLDKDKVAFIHAKMYIIDKKYGFSGSANFTYSGLNKNVESLNITETSEEVQKIRNDFMNLWMSNDGNSMSNEELFSELERENGGEELEEARKWEKEEADRREKARLEQERRIGQRKEAAGIQREYEYGGAHIEHREESSGGKWFNGLIIIFGVLALGWFVTQGSDSPQVSMNPAPAATPAAVVTSSPDQKSYTNSIGMEFVLIPAGEFDMGSPSNEKDRRNDEGPVHHVKISNTFYMGKYEVTQKQWRDVMGTSPSSFKGDDLPVEQVSWNDAQDFIKKINEKEGTNKYRLPSEAEWEYSSRAGTTTRYSFGNNESNLSEYAWYDANSGLTHEVGQKKPNPWGLYDMQGNVKEWIQDIYQNNYLGAPTDGTAWEIGDNSFRVVRGCSVGDDSAGRCGSASRRGFKSDIHSLLGFRLLREV